MALTPLRRVSRIKPPPPSVDYSSDPILLAIRALAARNDATAKATAAAERKKALEGFGYDPALQGLYGDPGTAGVAAQNPFSTLALLKRAHTGRQTALTENLNKAGLFYSSYRGQQLQNEGTQYLGEQAAASQKLQDYLGGVSQGLAGEQQASQAQIIQAEQDAYERALQRSLQSGGLPQPLTYQQRIRQLAKRARPG